ncbi:MAG: DUF721 domain-containing protein [Spirochaetota bacterium]|nr:DUF721 domain-containing protein [Spirochaetota bacterium]
MRKHNYQSNGEIERVGQLMLEYVHKQKWRDKLEEAGAVLIYNQLKDEQLITHSRAMSIAEGELLIHVNSPVVANEISLMSQRIITYINTKLRGRVVRKLKFKMAQLKPRSLDKPQSDPIKTIELSVNEKKEVKDYLARLDDPDLTWQLSELFTSIIKSSKRKNHE